MISCPQNGKLLHMGTYKRNDIWKHCTDSLSRIIGPVAVLGVLLLLVEQTAPLQQIPHILYGINLGILLLFATDIILNFAAAPQKRVWLRQHWFDGIVFFPLIQQLFFSAPGPLSTVLRQAALLAMLLSRARRAHKFISLLRLKPAQLMITSFGGAIVFGAILLMLPAATSAGQSTPLLDALFTATSAVCVTGLIVEDTAIHFSRFGQTIILALIQIGGLGIMTFSVSLALLLRRSVSFKDQSMMQDVLDQESLLHVRRLILLIFALTFLFEFIGASLLFMAWRPAFPSTVETLWHALFHAVSAFCNAGFSTFSDSLTPFAGHLPTNLTIAALIIAGGIGFVVMDDLFHAGKSRILQRHGPYRRFRIQTRLALSWTLGLLLIGSLLFFWVERNHMLADTQGVHALLLSFFQSVTTRTAGFNTCNIGALQPATLLLFIIFMFIGACPGGTAGGIKITTPAVLWSLTRAGLSGQGKPRLHRSTIPQDAVYKAIILLSGAIFLVLSALFLLALLEPGLAFLDLFFEMVSAFGTVGLSTGITSSLTPAARVLIMLVMFIGRLGPLTIGMAFLRRRRPAKYAYAEERIMIG